MTVQDAVLKSCRAAVKQVQFLWARTAVFVI
jgi:hypothetical protein